MSVTFPFHYSVLTALAHPALIFITSPTGILSSNLIFIYTQTANYFTH